MRDREGEIQAMNKRQRKLVYMTEIERENTGLAWSCISFKQTNIERQNGRDSKIVTVNKR